MEKSEKQSFLLDDEDKDQTENGSVRNVADMVKDIALNGMRVLEVKSYQINDKIKKLKKNSFKAFTLNEISVSCIDTKKEGYITINEGLLDIPIANLRIIDSDGPWYFTNKDKAIKKVVELNKIEYNTIKELQDEINASEDYLRDIVENNRY